jgi:hypothetical protein
MTVTAIADMIVIAMPEPEPPHVLDAEPEPELPAEAEPEPPPEIPYLAIESTPPEARPVTAPPGALRPVIDRGQASMLLEMATSKEQIGQVLEDWLRSTFGCGLVLVIKGDMAIGWKG